VNQVIYLFLLLERIWKRQYRRITLCDLQLLDCCKFCLKNIM